LFFAESEFEMDFGKQGDRLIGKDITRINYDGNIESPSAKKYQNNILSCALVH
jgi:hypothetical protein